MAWNDYNINNNKIPPTLATEKGHFNQERQNIQSTKPAARYDQRLKIIRYNFRKTKKNLPLGKIFCEALEEDIIADAFPIPDERHLKRKKLLIIFLNPAEHELDTPISLVDFILF